jgi:hypothetical protein
MVNMLTLDKTTENEEARRKRAAENRLTDEEAELKSAARALNRNNTGFASGTPPRADDASVVLGLDKDSNVITYDFMRYETAYPLVIMSGNGDPSTIRCVLSSIAPMFNEWEAVICDCGARIRDTDTHVDTGGNYSWIPEARPVAITLSDNIELDIEKVSEEIDRREGIVDRWNACHKTKCADIRDIPGLESTKNILLVVDSIDRMIPRLSIRTWLSSSIRVFTIITGPCRNIMNSLINPAWLLRGWMPNIEPCDSPRNDSIIKLMAHLPRSATSSMLVRGSEITMLRTPGIKPDRMKKIIADYCWKLPD